MTSCWWGFNLKNMSRNLLLFPSSKALLISALHACIIVSSAYTNPIKGTKTRTGLAKTAGLMDSNKAVGRVHYWAGPFGARWPLGKEKKFYQEIKNDDPSIWTGIKKQYGDEGKEPSTATIFKRLGQLTTATSWALAPSAHRRYLWVWDFPWQYLGFFLWCELFIQRH